MKDYKVKEIFLSLQGEGFWAGRRAIFVRFSGCNLWSGREQDRRGSCSAWCDTDFVGTDGELGGRFDAAGLAKTCEELWGPDENHRFVVFTGGEPLLQVNYGLSARFWGLGFDIAIETNGTRPTPCRFEWITVSPKAGTELALKTGDELKLVYPQEGLDPQSFLGLKFDHFFLQPKDGPDLAENTRAAIRYCLDHPGWRLGSQQHKVWGVK